MHFAVEEYCCTHLILAGFGEETVQWDDAMNKESPCAKDFKEFVQRLVTKVDSFADDNEDYQSHLGRYVEISDLAVITATTLDTQPIAAGFLKQFGFKSHGPCKREKYSQGKLTLWFLSVEQFLKKLAQHQKELK